MLDTLNAHFCPQFRPDLRTYMGRFLQRMEPYRSLNARPMVRVTPDASAATIAALGTYEGRVTVPSGSRLWGISGWSTDATGFDLQLRNTETHAPLFGRRVYFANATGQVQPGDAPASPLFFIPKPLLFVSDRGIAQITIQVWNRAAAANTVQLLLWFMSPEVL